MNARLERSPSLLYKLSWKVSHIERKPRLSRLVHSVLEFTRFPSVTIYFEVSCAMQQICPEVFKGVW